MPENPSPASFPMLLPGERLPKPQPPANASPGQRANRAAALHRFQDYRLRRAEQTLRRQDADLALFGSFLELAGMPAASLNLDPRAWKEITWGLVEAFVKWMLKEGYAVPSINVRLSTVKTYARLAMQAGTLSPEEYACIRAVQGFSRREQVRIDCKRPVQRLGAKKAAPVHLTPEQAHALKRQPETPQGRRDALMMCLLLDHGLRVGELAALAVDEIDINEGVLRFYRPKVNREQTHRLSPETLAALRACIRCGEMPGEGYLLRRSRKNGQLGEPGMSERAITARVCLLGKLVDVWGLSAHDCRHFWASSAARHGTDPFVLQQAGGWSSLAMPRRYIEDNEISNEGIKLE